MAINRAFEVVFEVVKPVRCTNDGCPFANDGISQADAIGCRAILNLLLHFLFSPGMRHLHIDVSMLAIKLAGAVCPCALTSAAGTAGSVQHRGSDYRR